MARVLHSGLGGGGFCSPYFRDSQKGLPIRGNHRGTKGGFNIIVWSKWGEGTTVGLQLWLSLPHLKSPRWVQVDFESFVGGGGVFCMDFS